MSQTASSYIMVDLTGMPLVADVKKPGRECREYELTVRAEGAQHTFCWRYSDWEKAISSFATDDNPWPSDLFSAFKDYVHKEYRVRRRGEELRRFTAGMLNQADEGAIVGNGRLHAALLIPPGAPIQAALLQVAMQRKQIADAARAAEAARRAAIARQQAEDAQLAQTFNSQLAVSNLPPGALSTIRFPRHQQFELRNKFWGWGDATIRGPGGHPWFKMVRSNPSMFGELFKNAHFAITTLAGEPLLVLQENFRWMNYEYDLFRVDPRSGAHVPICRIVRQWAPFAFADQYAVMHFNHFLTGRVDCYGRWPSQFSLTADGALVCRVEKELFTFTDTYQVHISPNTDCLLFIGIACAIDRIHHEVEDERRRRE